MKLQISSVADKGVSDKERIILKVLTPVDVGEFLLMQTGFTNTGVNISVYHSYWFPDKLASAGDLVVLYSKQGQASEKELENGRRAHFFYWGLPGAIWNTSNRAPVLLHVDEWKSKSPKEL